MPNLGASLRQLRQERRLTLARLARRVGVSAAYLSNVENGKAVPSSGLLTALAGVLKVDASELLGRETRSGEPLVPKASVVRRLKTELIRKAYEDVVHAGTPWGDVGWIEVAELSRLIPGRLGQTAIQDLTRMGVVERRDVSVRVRLDHAGEHGMARSLRAFRSYREQCVSERAVAERLLPQLQRLVPILAAAGPTSRRISGLYLMLQTTIVRVLPSWLIEAGVPPPIFERQRPQWYASLAMRTMGATGSASEVLQDAAELLRSLQIVREACASVLPPQAAPGEFSPIVNAAVEYYGLDELRTRVPFLDVCTSSWLLWNAATQEFGAPQTEEALFQVWRPAVFDVANRSSGEPYAAVDEWLADLGDDSLPIPTLDDPLDVGQLERETSPPAQALSSYRLSDAVCLPWDVT